MSQVLVSPLLASLTTNLNCLVQHGSELLKDVNKDLESLLSSLSSIKVAVDVAESKQVEDQTIVVWLTKLKDVAYVADDVVDEIAFGVVAEDGIASESNAREFVFSIRSCVDTIKEIREKVDEIASEGETMFDFDFPKRQLEVDDSEPIDLVLEEFRGVYGREKDKENVVGLLVNGGDLFLVPIVGVGGIGKTTVAQLAYNDERVERHFEIRMWFCVTEDFDVEKLTKEIVDRAIGKGHWISGVYELQRCLREMLSGKRFLIVLDGVSDGDQRKWGKLRKLLACGEAAGSKVIVTAQTEVIASIVNTAATYRLEGLSDDDCWSLFSQEAFGVERPEEFPNLVVIGKEIVKKCRGVPLGVKAVGSLLRFKREESEWLIINDDKVWNLPEDDGILRAFRLCYNHLSLHSKQCFAYCALFPRNYEIEKEILVQLWMANGFIPSVGGRMELEDIGHEIFIELVSRSFFQITQKNKDGNSTKYKVHDAAYDLARLIMGAECLKVHDEETPSFFPERIHHLSSTDVTSSMKALESLHKAETLRSYILLSSFSEYTNLAFPHYISEFKFLRVLDLRYTDMKSLPISMCNLKHLRYLDLSCSCIEALPESMTSLQQLQILKLRCCRSLRELPKNMKNMVSLRYLDISQCSSLTHLPKNISRLPCLQSLTAFVVGDKSGCGIEELQHLNLRGEFSITQARNVRDWTKAKEANLIAKPNLRSLEISWRGDASDTEKGSDEEVLDGLEPHPNLKRLEINYYNGAKFPRWMTDSALTNLEDVSLFWCAECETLPPFGELPFLKVLGIGCMGAVKSIGAEFYGTKSLKAFPLLEELTLKGMQNLEEWSGVEGREAFPNLRKLIIEECSNLTTLPWFPCLEDLDISDTNGTILRSVMNFRSLSSLSLNEFLMISLPDGFLRNLINLKSLTISRFPELTSLPEDLKYLTSLESLYIYACMSLISLPDDGIWQGLTSLRLLSIWYCRYMPSLPEGLQYLSSLRTLDIHGCDKLASLSKGLPQITTLQDLRISECDVLTSSLPEWLPKLTTLHDLCIQRSPSLITLPESIRSLTSLRCIKIQDMDNLKSLPEGIRHLTSLETLEIGGCRYLSSLPEWIGSLPLLCHLSICFCPAITSLPMALQSLAGLDYLCIRYCPHLERRCKKGTGEDWNKIAHVPRIIIQGNSDD